MHTRNIIQALLNRGEAETDPVALVDRILRAGLLAHASDIHFDPMEDRTRVRLRIDGELEDAIFIPAAMQSAVASRLKVLAALDIAERRSPQDGGFSWRIPAPQSGALDVRMATLPVRHGERITLRLLETGGRRLSLDDIGLAAEERQTFDRAIRRAWGLVLLTGPTGSGKTTTLYAAIAEILKAGAKNIVTVEDPVEYEIPGVAQVEVDPVADKVNYSKALRSLLRHDPDVCVIGEIRDGESAEAAVRCALTGHLVFSTLHTNDAAGAPARLADLGIDRSLIASTLRLVVAQRLVKRIGGGRIGVFETIAFDGTMSALDGARARRTMRDDAMCKVADGLTTLAEVERALGS